MEKKRKKSGVSREDKQKAAYFAAFTGSGLACILLALIPGYPAFGGYVAAAFMLALATARCGLQYGIAAYAVFAAAALPLGEEGLPFIIFFGVHGVFAGFFAKRKLIRFFLQFILRLTVLAVFLNVAITVCYNTSDTTVASIIELVGRIGKVGVFAAGNLVALGYDFLFGFALGRVLRELDRSIE